MVVKIQNASPAVTGKPGKTVKPEKAEPQLSKIGVEKKVKAKKYKATGKTVAQTTGAVEATTEEVIKEILSINEMATVGVMLGQTINLGNYSSCKLQVSLHLPCAPDMSGVDLAYAEAKTWVEGRMAELVAEVSPS